MADDFKFDSLDGANFPGDVSGRPPGPPAPPNRLRTKRFESGHTRATVTILFLGLGILMAPIAIWSDLAEINLLKQAERGKDITDAEADANDSRQQTIGLLEMAIGIVTAIAFMMWIHRAHRNLPSLGARGLKFTPGWSVGWFFVPIMNLFKPYQVAKEIWSHSEPDVPDAYGETQPRYAASPPYVVGWWWAAWILSNIVANISFRLTMRAEEIDEFLTGTKMDIACEVLGTISAILAILLVRGIDLNQEVKNEMIDSIEISVDKPGTL